MFYALKNIPIVLSLRKKLYENKFSTHQNVNYFRGVFDTFQEALASAPKTKPIGYDNSNSAKLYKNRINKIFSTYYPMLFWMQKIKEEVSSVFDFGGHIGIHYYSYLLLLDLPHFKKWTVCDVESVCTEGRKFANENDSKKKLDFVTDIKFCENYDLFIAKGSLQYLEWELHDKLKTLAKPPKYLIINTTPLHPSIKTVTLNSIGTAYCPYNIRKESDFFDGLKLIGYEVLDSWNNEEKSCNIAFEPERSVNYYRGAILKLK